MKVYYSNDYEDVVFAIEYLNLPISYSIIPKGLELHINDIKHTGLEEVLTALIELCRCDPHDLSIINDSTVKEIHKLRSMNSQTYLSTLLGPQEVLSDSFHSDVPSNIKVPTYINHSSLTLADLILFARIYKSIKEGALLKDKETEWFNNFQDEISKKMDIEKIEVPDLDILDIRVGRICNVAVHPGADALYVEDVLIPEQIQVVSGLRGKVPLEELKDGQFLFLKNLKASKLRGVLSEAMILCVKKDGLVEPIRAPEGAKSGDRVSAGGDRKPVVRHFEAKKIDAKSDKFKTVLGELRVEGNVLLFKGKKVLCNGMEVRTAMESGSVC